jgi:hypothetical protein
MSDLHHIKLTESEYVVFATVMGEEGYLGTDFEVYLVEGSLPDGTLFVDNGKVIPAIGLRDLGNAAWTLKVFVEYNGCANIDHGDIHLHTCSKEQAIEIGKLLGQLYDLAAKNGPMSD